MDKVKKPISLSDAQLFLGTFAVEALQENFDILKIWAKSAPISIKTEGSSAETGVPMVLIEDPQTERAFQMLEVYGVPRSRAKYVHNGIDVLMTRMNRELSHEVFLKEKLLLLAAEYAKTEKGTKATAILKALGREDLLK